MAIKVLMMGGRRCGKTSALASLFYQMINGETKSILSVSDVTQPQTKIDPQTGREISQPSLETKRLELQHFMSQGTTKNAPFMVDDNPTRAYWDYTLKVNIPGTKKSTEIIFKDADGEFFDFQSGHKTETEKYVNESNVFVVVVDTPYLMDKDRSIADAANVVGSIDSFIKELSAAEGVKQVIFVPIKCERWIHEGRIDDVIGKVEEVYDATIEELKHRNDTEISIIPIQTAGNIDFYELRPSYVVYNQDNGMTKQEVCSKISDRLVVLKSGKNHLLKPGDIVREDAKAVFFGTDGKPMDIARPSEWFKLRQDKDGIAKYEPKNCEQLALHIIRFVFNKLETESKGGLLGWLSRVLFGTITKADMQAALHSLSDRGLIKDGGDGITRMKKIF